MADHEAKWSGSAGATPRAVELELTVERFSREFGALFDRATIARIHQDSARVLGERLRAPARGPLAERLSRERLVALARAERQVESNVPSVLFLCVRNAGRSQMAAGWVRHLARDRALVFSGGSDPAVEVNPRVAEAMLEVGIDLRAEFPKPWTDEILRGADAVVTMGCGDECPVVLGVRYLDWPVDDPADAGDLQSVRRIRDEIERRVRGLLVELGIAAEE
jgi:protein-tyrosine-phosphatase